MPETTQSQAAQQTPHSGSESHQNTQKDSTNQSSNREFLHIAPEEWRASFHDIWSDATSDNRLTLFGFKRHRTAHLVNLRYLALEIEKVNYAIFQASLQVDRTPHHLDRLGLRYAKLDPGAPAAAEVIKHDTFLRLRQLIKEYGLYAGQFSVFMSAHITQMKLY